ncbi:MAG TPA: hypothetical protein VJV75_04135 [Candidatus Polarisedimenticolia bacterium]|nr:hypothetical protein [Candidatus Polarisedimenticolia bacterium]
MAETATHPSRPLRHAARGLVAAFLVVSMSGCAISRRYDMVRIHAVSAARPERHPVIVLHGLMGSKLRNERTHESVWGRLIDAITVSPHDDLALPIDDPTLDGNRDALVPYALYEHALGVKFYGAMIDALRDVGGYRMGDLENPRPDDTGFVYLYDWRRDNVESALRLGQSIRTMKERLGEPDLKFDIVAHSMGGMVALYYLMYGTEDVVSDGRSHEVTWAGSRDISRLVLVGTPLRGSMAAFRLLHQGAARTMATEIVFTMPSLYQLLPGPGESHFVDPEGAPVDLDLYDASTWVRQGWSVFAPAAGRSGRRAVAAASNPAEVESRARQTRFLQASLDRARGFREALDRVAGVEPPVPVNLFGSDCVPTLEKAVVKQTATGPVTEFADEDKPDREMRGIEKLLLAPGDGKITAASLLGSNPSTDELAGEPTGPHFASTFFVCATHGLIPANPSFQDNLFYVLFHGPGQTSPTRSPVHATTAAGR